MTTPHASNQFTVSQGGADIPVCPKVNISSLRADKNVCPTLIPLTSIDKAERRLPHWRGDSAIYWITFRLADSLPQDKLHHWRRERESWLGQNPEPWNDLQWMEYNTRFSSKLDEWLDAGYGCRALASPAIREVVCACLLRFEGDRFHLHGAVIMPNHVHILMEPIGTASLSDILKGIKGTSARKANQLMGTNGKFWLDESYDHIVRNERQYFHFLRYIANNPVKAGLNDQEYWLKVGQAFLPALNTRTNQIVDRADRADRADKNVCPTI